MKKEKEKEKMNVIKGENSIIIKLNKKFYDIATIKESIKKFSNVCEGKIEKRAEYIVVELKPKEKEMVDIIGYEFSNYVLGLMKNKNIV